MSSEKADLVKKAEIYEQVGQVNAAYESVEEGIDVTPPETKKLQAEFDTYAHYIAADHEPTEDDLRWTGPCMVWSCRFLLLCLAAGFACLIAWAATWVAQPCKIQCEGGTGCPNTYWGYTQTAGDHCWGRVWDKCNKQAQSPIDIDTKKVKLHGGELNGTWESDYDRDLSDVLIENDGRSVIMHMQDHGLQMRGPGLPSSYTLSHIIFHWGTSSISGSEHTINSMKFPLEMQLYHYDSNLGSFDEAKGKEGGVAALAYLFSISPEHNPAFWHLTNSLYHITYPKQNRTISGVNIGQMIKYVPEIGVHFYHYNGSLTTPDCSENVVWTVFADPLKISELQIHEFRYLLYTEEGKEPHVWISGNSRKNQSINNREILGGVYGNPYH